MDTALHRLNSKPGMIVALLLPVLYGSVRICLHDYRGWLGLGAGGLPYNFFGWVLQWLIKLTIAKRDTISLECYDKTLKIDLSESEKRRNDTNYLSSLPQRPGDRPKVAHWVIPHRQLRKAPTSQAVLQVKLPLLHLTYLGISDDEVTGLMICSPIVVCSTSSPRKERPQPR
jgi:hypothetical protein